MKKARLTLSASALVFGLFIVFVSLVSTNQVISYEGTQASQKKFYIGETILPDHVAYPFVAVADRLLLAAVPQSEKIHLQLIYSQIRMEYAQALLLKDEPYLSNVALTKSQKYAGLAAMDYFDNQVDDPELKNDVIKNLEDNILQAKKLIKELSPCQTTMAQQLNHNNQALLDQLTAE